MPDESVDSNECVCLDPGLVEPVKDAVGLGGTQGPSSVKGLPARGADTQDLGKSRTGEDALQPRAVEAPLLFRLRLGQLSKARNKRLNLVDCVCVKERGGETEKNIQFRGGVLPLTQRHTHTSAFRISSKPSSSCPPSIFKTPRPRHDLHSTEKKPCASAIFRARWKYPSACC